PARYDAEMERQLGADLWRLACSVGTVAAAMPLLGDNYFGYRPKAFRLRFADGLVLKGRCVETPQQAETVETLSRFLGHVGLPRVLARHGRALLTEWKDGRPLTANDDDPQVLRRCGALQGFAHTQAVPAGAYPQPSPAGQVWQATVQRNLNALVESAVLDDPGARPAATIARTHPPGDCAWGFAFRGFCADTIVRQPSGEVILVDTETLSIQPCDYDLGRTWYRWPMPRASRQSYFSGYRSYRGLDDFLAHFPFWAIA